MHAARYHDEITYFIGDLRNAGHLAGAMHGVSVVFHCAEASAALGLTAAHVRAVNIVGTANLVEACKDAGVGKLIYSSTAFVAPTRRGASAKDLAAAEAGSSSSSSGGGGGGGSGRGRMGVQGGGGSDGDGDADADGEGAPTLAMTDAAALWGSQKTALAEARGRGGGKQQQQQQQQGGSGHGVGDDVIDGADEAYPSADAHLCEWARTKRAAEQIVLAANGSIVSGAMPQSPKTPKRLRKPSGAGQPRESAVAGGGGGGGGVDSEDDDDDEGKRLVASEDDDSEDGGEGEGGNGRSGGSGSANRAAKGRSLFTCVLRSTVPFGLRRKHMRSTLLCSNTLFHPRSAARVDFVPIAAVARAHLQAEVALGADLNDGRPGLDEPGAAAGRAYFIGSGGGGSSFAKFARLQARVDRAQCSLAMPPALSRALAALNELGSRVLCFAPWTNSLTTLAVDLSTTTCLFDCSRAQRDLGYVLPVAAGGGDRWAATRRPSPAHCSFCVCVCVRVCVCVCLVPN